jgi:TatD DNase family protein
MKLVDVHSHLNSIEFKDDLDDVLERAKKAGVQAILVSGTNPPTNIQVLEMAKKHPIIKASLGIYPTDALGIAPDEAGLLHHKGKIDLEQQFKFIRDNLENVAAVGEVGMDFYWATKEDTELQQANNFRKIIQFCIEINKPIVIHSRKAEEECINILEEEIKNKEIAVIQHCFSGKKSLMTRAIELGHYFSIPPNILRASNFQTLVKKVPMEQILTETDSPWLSPFPGTKNEPANVKETIKKIAEVKNMSVKEISEAIWDNYQRIFT